jgi:dihydrodipicolinate synthase/N-acetylneuraminate lyase
MDTRPITSERLSQSVIAVPPMARSNDLKVDRSANGEMIRYLEQGGITTLLYGGNAVFYHIALAEYAETLQMLAETSGADTLVIPSAGPAYGTMMDQAEILKNFDFPTTMVLPQLDVATPAGRASGLRHFAERYNKPVVLYIKHEGYMDVDTVQGLMNDGVIAAIKYAIVRENPSEDAYLRELVDAIGPELVVSGIGEQPAISHMRDFGLAGFTSGCVCVAPRHSMQMLAACRDQRWDDAETLRKLFVGLEDLRNAIHPIRVLHEAVAVAGICQSGPITPLLSGLDDHEVKAVTQAAQKLMASEKAEA